MNATVVTSVMLLFSKPALRAYASIRPLICAGLLVCSVAADSAADDESPFDAAMRTHWAFQPIRRPVVPDVATSGTVPRNPIDAFVIRRLTERGLHLSTPADHAVILRRIAFDLTGLPPAETTGDTLLPDSLTDDAYEQRLDELLNSPHYGEVQGRAWLDLVRFAETAGFNADPKRPLAYKYRDYVVQSMNADKPFDRFVREQIAGDELYPDSRDAHIATGYNLMWPDESNASDVLLARQDALNDLTANVGAVFLGLSVGCAQCHDHKFDPILQTDFYSLQAFFVGVVPAESADIGSPEALEQYHQQRDRWLASTQAVRQELHALKSTARAKAGAVKRLKFPVVVLEAIDTAPELRTAFQRQLAFWSDRQIVVKDEELMKQLSTVQQQRRKDLDEQLKQLAAQRPKPPAQLKAMVVNEPADRLPETFLLDGGSYTSPSERLEPAFLTILAGDDDATIEPPRARTSGRRAAFSRWLTSGRHPLVARVVANRIWAQHFGRGLVENVNDFGTRTAPPSHPELLDWLASELVESGWSVKRLHRLIMTSAVYRQAARTNDGSERIANAMDIDPGNSMYWHFPRRRLQAESVRDSLLAVAGRLNRQMYGPGIQPELPPNFNSREAWKPDKNEADRNRRSLYIYAKRNLPYPMLKAFDFPDMHECCGRRSETTVAPQSLMLLNSEFVINQAEALAQRALGDGEPSSGDFVRNAWRIVLGREPDSQEVAAALEFIEQQSRLEAAATEDTTEKLHQAAVDLCHALVNSNEFLYLD